MNRIALATEILKLAKELVSMDFDTEEEMKKYKQEHDVRPGTKLKVKKDEKSPAAPKGESAPAAQAASPKELLEESSNKYHVQHVIPALKKALKKKITEGVTLRSSGTVNKGKGNVEMIADIDTGDGRGTKAATVTIHGSYMTDDDGEYDIYIQSPYMQGEHQYHDKFSGDPDADAKKISGDLKDMLDDVRGFMKGDLKNR